MSYDSITKIISAPVSFRDVQTALATSEQTLKGLCTHVNVNMWSRYKPVPFKNKMFFEDTIKTVNSHTSWNDSPITVGDGAQGLPWFRGSYNYPTYNVPTISSYYEMFSDGSANPSSKWIYNKPNATVGHPFRLTDFAGYNHKAVCPLQAYTNYTPFTDADNNVTLGKTHIDQYIYAGFNNLENALDNNLAKENGELSFSDIVGFMTNVNPAPLYLCIVIHNVTQNITRSYSKATNILTTEGQSFQLQINNSSNIANGGVAHTVALNDVLEIGVYLSQTPGVESVGTQLNLGFSLNTDSAYNVCRTVTVGTPSTAALTRYRILYAINSFGYRAEGYLDELDAGFVTPLPVWINTGETFSDTTGVAYQIDKGISNISAYLTIQKLQLYNNVTKAWEDTTQDSNFIFDLDLLVRASSGADSIVFGNLVLTSARYNGTNLASQFTFSGNKEGACQYYTSQADAENKLYGNPIACIPLALPKSGQASYTSIDFLLSLAAKLISKAGGIENVTLETVAVSGISHLEINN